jgi:hypothetical protein
LQRPTIPPQGHDAHQVVEHAIGVIKSWVRKQLARARREERVLTCKMLAGAVKQGQARFTAHSLAKNLKQLHVCMRVVAAEKSEVVRWEREWVKKDGEVARKWMHCQGTAGGFPPKPLS